MEVVAKVFAIKNSYGTKHIYYKPKSYLGVNASKFGLPSYGGTAWFMFGNNYGKEAVSVCCC